MTQNVPRLPVFVIVSSPRFDWPPPSPLCK